MKNFTPFGRLLLMAVFLLSAIGLSAQQSCNLDPSLIEISVKNTCTDGGATVQPYVTIDFGSTAVDGMTEITLESFFLGNINLGTYTITIPVSFGFSTFELPGFALPTPNNFVRLNEVEDLETGCVQTFGAGDVQSGFYSLTTNAAIAITKDNTRSIDPPCSGIPTGKLSIRVSPSDGMFPNNRFNTSPQDVRLVPSTFANFVSVIPPGTSPNPVNSGYYIVETNQSLVSGDYTFLLFDNVTGCEVSFETVVGDPSNEFGVEGQSSPVTCFDDTNGSIMIIPQNANPLINGFLNYTLNGPNGLQRTGTIAASNGIYNMPTESNLEAGEYTLLLNASNGGCMGEDIITVVSPDEIIVNDLAVAPICASDGSFVITASSITGIDATATYRLIDGSQVDPAITDNTCWDRSATLLSGGLQGDNSYEFSVFTPGIGFCRQLDRDTVITVYMEVETLSGTNPLFTCLDTFQFDVQIDAQPATPVVSLTATNLLGDPANPSFCSNQDVAIDIDNFVAADLSYTITYTAVTGVTGVDDFVSTTIAYTGPGSVVGSFGNTTNSQQIMNFEVTAKSEVSGCASVVETFSIPVRPQPVVNAISPSTAIVCSREVYTSPAITLNGNSGNANVRFDYNWTFDAANLTILTAPAGTGLNSGDQVDGRFHNISGVNQTAILTITPTFPQNSGNNCAGEPSVITVTVASRPSLNYDLTIGSLNTTLASPDVAAYEICNGEDFLLDNLSIPEDHAGNKAKYVRFRVLGDARFLQINTGGAGFGPTDVQANQFLAIDNFAIGQPNIQNNHPTNNAQVAEIILTPYFEDEQGASDFPLCSGQPIRLFLTLNPTPPTLPSPQTETVCSEERIEYTIMGASGNGSTLETRITSANVFSGQTDATFTVPAGANRIEDFRFELTGGNGGGTTTTGGVGGFGAAVTGSLSDLELLPGDEVTIRKGLAGDANDRNGNGGDATILTVTRGGTVIHTFVAGGGGGAGSAEDGRNGRNFNSNPASDGAQGQGPGGFGGTGFGGSPVAGGGDGNINGGGGGGGWIGGTGGNSQIGEAGQGGASFSSTTTAPASFAPKADTELADGQAGIFYTVVYDDIRFTLASQTVPAGLTPTGESIVDGEVDTILFGQQFENLTDGALTVSYVFNTSTEAMCDDGGQVTVDVTIEPTPTVTIASGSTTTVTGDAIAGFEATVCSGDPINAILNSLTVPSVNPNRLYFEVTTMTTTGTSTFGSNNQAASSSIDFGGNNTGDDLPIDFFETEVANNTGADGTITYTITPFIRSPGPNCAGTPITFTVTVQPGFNVDMNQPTETVCSREALNTVFDLDGTQTFANTFNEIQVTGFRVVPASADFTITGLDTTGLSAGGFMLDRTGNFFNDASFTNRTGDDVEVDIDVVFISGVGCESQTVTYPFTIFAEPIIDESNTAITICEGEAAGLSVMPSTNSAFASSFAPTDVTFSYVLDAGNLIYTGVNTYPVSGVGAFRFQGATFDNPTSTPQTATYTVVATTSFGCASQPVTYEVTVLPRPELALTASQGAVSINGQEQVANIETLTICSGSTVDFGISQDVTGTGVSYRIQRDVTGTVTNGDGSPVDNFEGGLAVANSQETLINTGTGSAAVQYKIEAYTYGPNGLDDNGLSASDDCVGVTQRVNIEVLPAATDESALDNGITINTPNVGNTNPGNGAQICDNSEVIIRPLSLIDPATGAAFIWRRENDGTLLAGATSGSGEFQNSTNNNNYFPAVGADRIREVLTALDDQTTEVRYIVTLYSFGTDGVNDMLAAGSDDCIGDIDTVTLQLDPTPVLTADLEIGTATVASLDAAGSTYTYEICSGEDFLLDNLAFPELADGKLKYVEFSAIGQIEFLGLTSGGFGTFQSISPIGNFSLGAQNVQNTEPNGLAQTAFLFLTPYYEDGVNTNDRDASECSGETIQITVTINATPPALGPFTETVCSEERVEYQIPGSSNTGFRSRVAGSTTFDASDDFVVPPGAARIFNVNISLNGANGGGSANNRGGLGGVVETSINPLFPFSGDPTILFPGDTVRVRKSAGGTSGLTNGIGGDATILSIIAGPSVDQPVAEGMIVETLLAGGGGGAGFADAGADAGAEENSPESDGANGVGLGGFGGTGFAAVDPESGSLGGAGRGNGGGGAGGWNGGDGGSNVNGLAGGFGTSFAGPQTNANFSSKVFSAPAEGTVTMDYILVYDDVRFDVVSRTIGAGLIDISDNPIVNGEVDTILYGERFDNPTDTPIDVVYVFATSSEANCPGGQVEVTLTVEPTPTMTLASNGTMIIDAGNGAYTAEICSGDSLSAVLSSMTIPSQGTNVVRARVIDVETSSADVTFGTGDGGEVNASANLNGNNQPSTNDLPFYEASIFNVGATVGTVTYTVVPYIINTVGSSGVECVGDTLTLTMTVYPEFVGVDAGPIMSNVCSNVSLEDTGFDVDATQPVQIMFDSIIIDAVTNTAGGDMNFETISSVYSGTPVTVRRSLDFFNGDTYRNRTGGPVFVTYEVRLVSGPGCTSDPIMYEFRYSAEPVIDIVESVTNQIDTTICSTDATGIIVNPAANSAFSNPADFQNNITLNYEAVVPQGIVLTNGTYPASGGRFLATNDELENTTSAPLDVVYTVTPVNGTCPGDAVTYTVTVNPNPDATVMLTSLDSTASFSLALINPNPEFGLCSGQALTASVPAVATSDVGTLMAVFTVTVDPDGISGYPVGTAILFPAAGLGDSLSYAMGELVNTTPTEQRFTVQYTTYFESNGTPGNQNDGVDCGSNGTVEFDIVLNPVNEAVVEVRPTDGSIPPIPTGSDTLCSGEAFDLVVKALNNNPTPVVDSFIVTIDLPSGMSAGAGTFSTDTTLYAADYSNVGAQFTRLEDLSFINATPGIKTVTYTATPYTAGCAGIPDTTTISYRAEIDLIANESVICADAGVSTSLFAIDANDGLISNDPLEYRYQYIGGTAFGYTLQAGDGTGLALFVFDPIVQANAANLVFDDQRSVLVTPSPNFSNFSPGTVEFQVIYDDTDNMCGTVTDTITLNFQTTADAGTANLALGILCDEVNFVLDGGLVGQDPNGVFTFTNGDPGLGTLNGANFTPMVGGSDPTPVAVDFTYTVGGGNSGCAVDFADFTVMVEPAPNAGTYDGTIGEACESAAAYNIFDLLDGEMQNGSFTQTSGIDFVTVNPDGTIDQDNITPGAYEFSYEVMSANGCGSDMVTGITVQVNDLMGCSTVIACDTIDMNPGFNVISFDVLPNDRSVESIFAAEIANNTLLTVIAIHPDEQASAQLYSFNPTFGTVSSGIAALRPGFGYVVELASPAQVITCGTAVDPTIRVELQSGLNIVGYTSPGSESIFDYFNVLIGANDVNLIRTIESGILRQLRFNPNPSGNLFTVRNSNGYLLDVSSAYSDGTWREGEVMPTSNFDRLFGYTNLSGDMAGQTIRFTDAEGNLYGRAELRNDGTYDDVMLYGDLTETARLREGLEQGEEIFAEFQGERIATGETFSGNWNLRQMDLNFNTVVDVPETVSDFAMSVFPNPTSGDVQVNLDLDQNYESVRVEVYSLLGQLVIERNLAAVQAGRNQVELDFTDLAAGTYQLRITTKDGVKGHAQVIRQ